jgi:hypothetical protein
LFSGVFHVNLIKADLLKVFEMVSPRLRLDEEKKYLNIKRKSLTKT